MSLVLRESQRSRLTAGFWTKVGSRVERVAASNILSISSPVWAEHSKYLTAPNSRAMAAPFSMSHGRARKKGGARTSSVETGFCSLLCSAASVSGSFRRVLLHPTKRIGSVGQNCRTSGNHYYINLLSRIGLQCLERY